VILLVLPLVQWHFTNNKARKVLKQSAFIVMEHDTISHHHCPAFLPAWVAYHHWK
jgi:hypothetical protein